MVYGKLKKSKRTARVLEVFSAFFFSLRAGAENHPPVTASYTIWLRTSSGRLLASRHSSVTNRIDFAQRRWRGFRSTPAAPDLGKSGDGEWLATSWNQLGRRVKKGEKGVRILAPIIGARGKPQEEAEKDLTRQNVPVLVGFRAAYVFDVSQTEGKELPEHARVSGDAGANRDRLIEFINAQGIELEFNETHCASNGHELRRQDRSTAGTIEG
jgi:hypothetical protein